jgi:hypothetical protein
VLTGSVLLPAPAEALTLRLEQHRRGPLFDSNGQSVRTVAYFEDDSITGAGTEDVLVDLMGVTGFLFGVGQNFNFAQFTMPPNFTTDYNIYVRYVGGAFSSIHNVNTGGASLTPLGPTINPPSDSGLRISQGRRPDRLRPRALPEHPHPLLHGDHGGERPRTHHRPSPRLRAAGTGGASRSENSSSSRPTTPRAETAAPAAQPLATHSGCPRPATGSDPPPFMTNPRWI